MKYLATILRFGWPYLRRYRERLFLGVVLGLIFGLSNVGILGASKMVLVRLEPPAVQPPGSIQTTIANKVPLPPALESLKTSWRQFTESLNQMLDPWLPVANRPLDPRQIAGILFLLPLLMATRGFVGYLSSYCLGWVSERVVNDMRLDVLLKLNSLSLDFFNRSTIGDLLARVNNDTTALLRTLNFGFSDLIKEPFTILLVLGYLCYLDWKLTFFVLIFFPLCVVPIVVLGRKIRKASSGSILAGVSQASLLVELISSIRVVKAFNLEAQQVERYRDFSRDLVRHGVRGMKARELVNPIIETISAIGLGLLIVWIFHTGRSLSHMVVFLGGVISIYTPIKKLSGLAVLFQQTSVGVDRLMKIMAEEPTVKEPAQPKTLARFESAITFDGVSFTYGNQLVVKDMKLTIPRGFKLGVAGESGSGKSTLVNLVFRFYDPTQGIIKIDGVDLRDLATHNLRQLMALVSQEVVIFDQTVAENIACGRPGATPAEVEAAARAAYAHDFIMELKDGYHTRLGERGVTLSGGQRQRVAIARAFIRNAPILVLDEATAALDSQSEAEVQIAIDRLTENRTVICVAHRLSTLATTDQIIVLSQGRIIEQGSYADLLRAGGPFAAMASRQGINAAQV